ncbi:hypothetical protein DBT_2325 [Dissulfuribacter thermophilus]|uniref:Uncharacterized protein n=1 Tax=Dissulfuribacter thermophilus TaxID=1156395 RepID=A0A1B9F301_9BACT|nr:hypothetical protein [Dissulfuribacter thermophilus]OCC14253.1 hypothetical protein DBT_2325 [Dissulfuribacter thermophilus]
MTDSGKARIRSLALSVCLILVSVSIVWAGESRIPDSLIKDIQKLDLGRAGYRLCYPLSEEQLRKAEEQSLPPTAEGTFRFKDGDLQIVAEKDSNLVILISEYHKVWSRKAIKDLVGSFTLGYGFPTTTAHGQTLYWFFSADGELLDENNYKDYITQNGNGSVIATIKVQTTSFLRSERDKGKGDGVSSDEPDSGYYLIYSSPILEMFVKQ